ncbi:hypothetical protein AMTRI_Chr08g167400 [Amborella trichopoda]
MKLKMNVNKWSSQQQRKSSLWDEELMVRFLSAVSESIVFQIPLALPVESICRFRCTCKSWQELFSSLEFARIYYLSPTPPSEPFALISMSFRFLFLCPSKNLMFLKFHPTRNYSVFLKFHSIFQRIKAFYLDPINQTFKVSTLFPDKERLLQSMVCVMECSQIWVRKCCLLLHIEKDEEEWEVIPLPSQVTTQVHSNCSLFGDLGIWKLSKEEKWEVMGEHLDRTFVFGEYNVISPPHHARLDVIPYWNVGLHLYCISGKRRNMNDPLSKRDCTCIDKNHTFLHAVLIIFI